MQDSTIHKLGCPSCGAAYDPKSRSCQYCGCILIVTGDIGTSAQGPSNPSQISAAAKKWRQKIQADPDDGDAHFALGLCYLNCNLHDEAIAQLREACDLIPESADAHYTLAATFLKKLDFDRGLSRNDQAEFEKQINYALRISPDFTEAKAFRSFSIACRESNASPRALTEYRRAADLCPDVVLFQTSLGQCYLVAGDTDAAASCFEKALALNANDGVSCANLSAIRAKQQRYGEGIELASRAIDLDADAYDALARNLWGAGQRPEAKAAWRTASSLRPDDRTIAASLAMVEAYDAGVLAQAKRVVQRRRALKVVSAGVAVIVLLWIFGRNIQGPVAPAVAGNSGQATPAAAEAVDAASPASDPQLQPVGQVPVQNVAFDQYKTNVYSGPIVYPDFNGAQRAYRDYRTRINEAAKAGVNFAGHYALVKFGCGSGCAAGYLVDLATGDVHDLGYGGEEQMYLDIDARPDSKLMKVNYSSGSCVREAAVWDGGGFQVVARDITPYAADDEMGMGCPPIAETPASVAMPETVTPAEQPTADVDSAAQAPSSGPSPLVQSLMDKRQGPSFECASVTNPTAVTICGNPELGRLDLQMAILYFSHTRDGTDPLARAQQRAWIQERNSQCGVDVSCLRAKFQSRIAQLQHPQQPQPAESAQSVPAPAPSPDDTYATRTNGECHRGFFGRSCRRKIRDQVCGGKTGTEPGASVCAQ